MTKGDDMRISKRVREEAILICDATAADYAANVDAGAAIESFRGEAATLADEACDVVQRVLPVAWNLAVREVLCLDYAEAAALLRSGWSPGDPVTLRKVTP
jgi:hypothetical protein